MYNSNTSQENYSSGRNSGGNLTYLLAGCGIGATLALLFAPKSGRELRSDISDISRKGYDETLVLAQELKDRSAELYQSMREGADRVYDLAATKLHLAERTMEDAANTALEPANGEIGRQGSTSPRKGAGGDRASNIF